MLLLPLLCRALPFVPTTDPNAPSTHWYQLKTLNTYICANGSIYSAIDLSATASISDNYLWCFVTMPSGEYALYNRMRKQYLHGGVYFNPDIRNNICFVEDTNESDFYIRFRSDNMKFYFVFEVEYNVFQGSSIPENSYSVSEVPVVPPPEINCYIFPDRGVIDVVGEGNIQLTINGSNVSCPYTMMRTAEDQHIVVTATAQMTGMPSGVSTEEFTSPQMLRLGDVTADGTVDISDINAIINIMLGKAPQTYASDVTGDDNVDISDVNAVINIMLGKVDVAEPTITTYTANGVSFNMVEVVGGTFTMGSKYVIYANVEHQVTLSTFNIGQTEVTQELWRAVMGSNPSHHKGATYPVEMISWNDCQTFITKLNQLTGKTFRLPTEAEWEYAARGGNKSHGYTYAGSNDVDDVAWYDANSGNQSHVVATKYPNELWLYDMCGNATEWCQDWWGTYSAEAQTNPTGPSDGTMRVKRGGHYGTSSSSCQVVHREEASPTYNNINSGLRLAM